MNLKSRTNLTNLIDILVGLLGTFKGVYNPFDYDLDLVSLL